MRAEILRPDEAFVHPLVRDAVYLELPLARRGLEHARAARLLAGSARARTSRRAADPPPPRRDPGWWSGCARRRAIAIEPGRPTRRSRNWSARRTSRRRASCAALALELGGAAEFVRGPAPPRRSRGARGLTDPVARATAAIMLARTLLFMEARARRRASSTSPARAPGRGRGPAPGAAAIRIVGVFFGVAEPAKLAELEAGGAGPRGRGRARRLTAITGLAVAIQSGDAEEASALVDESLDGDEMPAFDRGVFTALPAASLAMTSRRQPSASGSASQAAGGRDRCWTPSAPTGGAG